METLFAICNGWRDWIPFTSPRRIDALAGSGILAMKNWLIYPNFVTSIYRDLAFLIFVSAALTPPPGLQTADVLSPGDWGLFSIPSVGIWSLCLGGAVATVSDAVAAVASPSSPVATHPLWSLMTSDRRRTRANSAPTAPPELAGRSQTDRLRMSESSSGSAGYSHSQPMAGHCQITDWITDIQTGNRPQLFSISPLKPFRTDAIWEGSRSNASCGLVYNISTRLASHWNACERIAGRWTRNRVHSLRVLLRTGKSWCAHRAHISTIFRGSFVRKLII